MPSIAIIGASKTREKFGNKCIRAYLQLGWTVYPINPKEEQIEGLKCYHSIKELPAKPDRVSVYLPAQVSISIIPELLNSKINQVILNPGAESDELVAALKKSGITPQLICSMRMEGINPDKL